MLISPKISHRILVGMTLVFLIATLIVAAEVTLFQMNAVEGVGVVQSYEFRHKTCRGVRSSKYDCTQFLANIHVSPPVAETIQLDAGRVKGFTNSPQQARWPVGTQVNLLYEVGKVSKARENNFFSLWKSVLQLSLTTGLCALLVSPIMNWFFIKVEEIRTRRYEKRRKWKLWKRNQEWRIKNTKI